jgi:hypothetical protein
LLILELVVQFFEGTFYVWLAYNFTKVLNVTPKRYIDWTITTPTMLITLMTYLIYLNKMVENKTYSPTDVISEHVVYTNLTDEGEQPEYNEKTDGVEATSIFSPNELDFFTILKDNSKIFISVVFLNWLMLLFGYLGEMKIIPVLLGVFLGFIPFLLYYYIIYVNYVTQNTNGYLLFWYFFFFWSMYGFVAVLPYYVKNTFYNILDLFAKNFFGIFLSYVIFSGNY